MKKIFSFLSLLLLTCSMAWASSKTYTFDDDVELATDWTVTTNLPNGGEAVCVITNSLSGASFNARDVESNYLGLAYKNNSGISITIVSTASYSDITGLSFDVVASDNSKPNFSAYIVDNNGDVIETLFETYGLKNDFGNPGTNKWGAYSNNSIASKSGHLKIVTYASSSGKYAALDNITITYVESGPEPGGDPEAPSITTQPTNQTVGQGESADLSVVATGSPAPTYQWYSCEDVEKTGAIAIDGATAAIYSPNTASIGTTYYYVVLTNAQGSVTSNVVSVKVNEADRILFSANAITAYSVPASSVETPYEDISSKATISGGSIFAHNGQSSAKNLVASTNNVCFAFTNNNTNFKVVLDEALEAGDIISSKVGNSKNYGIKIYTTENLNGYAASDDTYDAIILNPGTSFGEGTSYTVKNSDTNLIGATTFYIYRATGNSTYFDELTITRPAPSTDPIILAVNDAEIKTFESGVEVTEDIDISGSNLSGEVLTATLSPEVPGLGVSLSVDNIVNGEINTIATLSFSATANVSGVTTLTLSDGTTIKEITISYRAKVVYSELQAISGGKTWDFSDLTGTVELVGTEATTDYVYADIDGVTFEESFDKFAIAFMGQYPVRNDKMCQNGTLHIKTTIPGVLTVDFSDTGNSGDSYERYLNINGNNTEYFTMRTGDDNGRLTASVAVAAGDIYIKGMKEDGETAAAICVYSLKFTPTEITLGANGYSTYAADFKYTVSGATVYKAAYNGSDAVVLTEVVDAVVPANQGIILKGTVGATATITLSNDDASNFSDNDLEGVVSATTAPANAYALATDLDGDGLTKFHLCAGIEIPANKAYIIINGQNPAPAVRIIEAGNGATGINELEGAEKAVKFIENGKLYIQKDGVVYDATGAKVK